MILLLTNKEDITADFVVLELKRRNVNFFRFNTEDFPQKIRIKIGFHNDKLEGCFCTHNNKIIPFSSIKSIWYRRPSPAKLGEKLKREESIFCIKECQQSLNGIWHNLKCFWVSEPQKIHYAENKITQLTIAQKIGFKIPETLISNNPEEIIRFYNNCNKNIVVKPIKSGLIEDNIVVFTNKVTSDKIKNIKSAIQTPSIYQENIPKQFDIRITVIGTKVFPVEIHSQENRNTRYDWRKSQDLDMVQQKHILPKEIKDKCIKLLDMFDLKFGAIDMILTPEGEYYFLEINPNGQWAWIEKRTGYELTKALVDILIEGKV